jgi:predicted dehydrogenase
MIRVGIIGCGFMGRMHASVLKELPGAELVGCLDLKSERSAKYAQEFGLKVFPTVESMAPQVDVIDVCTPTDAHHGYVLQAAAAGKHVFCEKPIALSVEQADEMIDACREAGVRLMVGHCIRFWPEYVKLKELADSGELGALLSLNLTRYGGFPKWATDGWNLAEERCGGGVLDMHIHDTDFALYLLGEPDSMISHGSVDERGAGHAFTTMTYREGQTIVHLEGGWNLPTGAPFKMAFRAVFEKGAAIWDAGPLGIYRDGAEPEFPEFAKMEAEGGGNLSDLGGYYGEWADFVERLEAGRPLEIVTPESSRLSLKYTLDEIAQIKAKAGR